MSEKEPFLILDERHALGADDLQWILFRSHERSKPRRFPWDGISFVRSTKAVLMRCIREKGIKPTPEALEALAALPDTFDEWKIARSMALEAV